MPITRSVLSKSKNLPHWRDAILRSLGGREWNIELSDADLDHALYQALILFNKYMPFHKEKPLGEVSTCPGVLGKITMEFDVSDEPEGVQVSFVKFQKGYKREHGAFYHPYHHQFSGMRGPRKLLKYFVAQDRYDDFLGTNPSWDIKSEIQETHEGIRTLYVSAPGHFHGTMATAILLLPRNIDQIPHHREADFLKCATGYAKQILGRKLNKFGAIPAAQGDITLDGDSLKSEGVEEVKEVTALLDRNLADKMSIRSIH